MQGQTMSVQGRAFFMCIWVISEILFAAALVAIIIITAIDLGYDIDNNFTLDGDCFSNDPCKKGLTLHGACIDNWKKDGSKCGPSSCYDAPAAGSSHQCVHHTYDQFGAFVDASFCEGTTSVGECLVTADCPNITFASFVTASSTKDCDSEACYYTLDLSGGENDDITTPCTVDSPVWQQVCYGKLNDTEDFVTDNCLAAQPVCSGPNITSCMYFFRDAIPEEAILILRDAPEVYKRTPTPSNFAKKNNDNLGKLEQLYTQQRSGDSN